MTTEAPALVGVAPNDSDELEDRLSPKHLRILPADLHVPMLSLEYIPQYLRYSWFTMLWTGVMLLETFFLCWGGVVELRWYWLPAWFLLVFLSMGWFILWVPWRMATTQIRIFISLRDRQVKSWRPRWWRREARSWDARWKVGGLISIDAQHNVEGTLRDSDGKIVSTEKAKTILGTRELRNKPGEQPVVGIPFEPMQAERPGRDLVTSTDLYAAYAGRRGAIATLVTKKAGLQQVFELSIYGMVIGGLLVFLYLVVDSVMRAE